MRPKRLVMYGVLTVGFAVITAMALIEHSYIDLWRFAFAGSANLQVFADLVVAVFLFSSWMMGDARARGLTVWPFLIVTILAGSFGLLSYMLYREVRANPATS